MGSWCLTEIKDLVKCQNHMPQQGLISGLKTDMVMGYFEEKEKKKERRSNLSWLMIGFILGGVTLMGMLALGRFLYGVPDCVTYGIC